MGSMSEACLCVLQIDSLAVFDISGEYVCTFLLVCSCLVIYPCYNLFATQWLDLFHTFTPNMVCTVDCRLNV